MDGILQGRLNLAKRERHRYCTVENQEILQG